MNNLFEDNRFGLNDNVIIIAIVFAVILALIIIIRLEKGKKKARRKMIKYYDNNQVINATSITNTTNTDNTLIDRKVDEILNDGKTPKKIDIRPQSKSALRSDIINRSVSNSTINNVYKNTYIEEMEKSKIKHNDNIYNNNNNINNTLNMPNKESKEEIKEKLSVNSKGNIELPKSLEVKSIYHKQKPIEKQAKEIKKVKAINPNTTYEEEKVINNQEINKDNPIKQELKEEILVNKEEKRNEVVYKENEPSKQEAKKVLEEVTQKLVNNEQTNTKTNSFTNTNNTQTSFELEQEEKSVISYDELKKINYDIDAVNDRVLKDEGTMPITIEELYKKHLEEQEELNKIDPNPIFEHDDKTEEIPILTQEETKKIKEVTNYQELKKPDNDLEKTKFKNSEVISPVFGIYKNPDKEKPKTSIFKRKTEPVEPLTNQTERVELDKNYVDTKESKKTFLSRKEYKKLEDKNNNNTSDFINISSKKELLSDTEDLSDLEIELKKTEDFLEELKRLKGKL